MTNVEMAEFKDFLNAFQTYIHKNAVEHGWWVEERSVGDICSLIHSELSEALEEYRDGRPLVWYGPDGKPEGIAVELADAVIRILDWFGKEGLAFDDGYVRDETVPDDFGTFLARCHLYVANAFSPFNDEAGKRTSRRFACRWLSKTIWLIKEWSLKEDVDLCEIIRIKHDYNKTRPYRHGGKRL